MQKKTMLAIILVAATAGAAAILGGGNGKLGLTTSVAQTWDPNQCTDKPTREEIRLCKAVSVCFEQGTYVDWYGENLCTDGNRTCTAKRKDGRDSYSVNCESGEAAKQ